MHLVRHWWTRDNPPYPSKKAIAECMNLDVSTVRRCIAAMEEAGLLRREARFDKNSGQKSNEYHLDGLIKEAIPYAKEMIDAQKQRREEAASRRIRKRPKLEAVKDK